MGCLYQLTSPNGKSYVGITNKSAEARWRKHIEHALGKRDAGAIYNAIRKYGVESFTVETLVVSDNWDYLCDLEKKAIARFNTQSPNGYNITKGGEGAVGRVISDSERLKISVAQKQRYSDPTQRTLLKQYGDRARKANAAKHAARRIDGKAPWQVRDEKERERKRLLPKRVYGRAMSAEARQIISERTKRGMTRPEVKAKVLACAQARAASPEWRAKISASKTGKTTKPCSEERKAKIAAARRREWADPVVRARRLAAFALARQSRKGDK